MTIRRTNPRKQGEIGLGAAIAWFLAEGYAVAIPLCDNQPWDLVVDSEADGLQKVQVKTTTQRMPYGNFSLQISTRGRQPELSHHEVLGSGSQRSALRADRRR